ncbi:MAG TPA: trehalose-6-phosphate synthase [Rhizomicrobium sp.]|nr:trehalose-6-phosphate synthase [Rhizomicrobium sp.]
MTRLVIVSNRVPLPRKGPQAGGLAVVLKDIVKPGTLWFGWSGKTSSVDNEEAQIAVHGGISYATIDLAEETYKKFYVGMSNGTLWPMFHFRLNLIDFCRQNFEGYRKANERFAEALVKLLLPDDLIWVHDYHLIPLGAQLRALGVKNRIGFFLHVPFVPASVFAVMPRAESLLKDFCAYDIAGFQTETHRSDFLDCVRRILEYRIDSKGAVSAPLRELATLVAPVGIEPEQFRRQAETSARGRNGQRLTESLAGRRLMIGADRLDYSKGLPNRFEAFNRLLSRFPEHRSRVNFLQIAAPSREDVAEYQALRPVLNRIAGEVNARHGAFDWVPLRYMSQGLARSTLAGFYRLSRVGVVTPFSDGMNLVAHEYLAAQDATDPGVLVLSQFAGSASYLNDALIVNPYDPDEIAEAMHQALVMGVLERQRRHARLTECLADLTASSYCSNFLAALSLPSASRSAA